MSIRGDNFVEFAAQVLKHVETYTVPQFGDAPDDQIEKWSPEDCVRQIGKYVARFGKNQRGKEDQLRDMLKIATMQVWHMRSYRPRLMGGAK